MKRYIIAVVGLGIMLAFSSCNTLRGAGEDVQSVGRGLQRAGSTR